MYRVLVFLYVLYLNWNFALFTFLLLYTYKLIFYEHKQKQKMKYYNSLRKYKMMIGIDIINIKTTQWYSFDRYSLIQNGIKNGT